jgi:hypothetical protein
MSYEFLELLLAQDDVGAEDSVQAHFDIRDEVARRAIAHACGWARAVLDDADSLPPTAIAASGLLH